ncbi:MAG: hypothetical protein QM438_10125 [Euryarchaeota archaeon]|nr:hypothetical protein [Euryarchaeota archaeon]
MTLTQEKISKTVELMQDRSEAPKLTPEQLNAIDLLILGKTDREVAEAVGVRRETVTKWHKNPFFSAELSIRREVLWVDAKLRLKSLAHEAVNVLTRGLSSQDEKVAITAAVHILKTVGLYGEVKQDFGPDTPEEAVWKQAVEQRRHVYTALRPDSFFDWSEKSHMTELAKEDVAERMRYWYERAVDEQKKELRGSLSFAYASNMYHRVNDISNRLFCSGNRNRKYAA